MSDDFFPPGEDFQQVLEKQFDELHALAAGVFPPSLRRSPMVGAALDKALQRFRAQAGTAKRFDELLREQAREEWSVLMDQIVPMVRKLVKRNKGLARVAEDVQTEVFLSLHRTRSEYDPAVAPFHAWVRGVAKRLAVRLLSREFRAIARVRDVEAAGLAVDPSPGPGEEPDPIPPFEVIFAQLEAALTDDLDRRIFRLKYQDNQPNKRIAATLNLNMNALYKRLERLRRRLGPLGDLFYDFS
jgi:RNA polymerase sigma factor (sigma-70 family)